MAKCASASLNKSFLSPELAGLLTEPTELSAYLAGELALVEGRPRRWATALQERPSCRQRSTASAFCCAVNRRRVLVGSVIDAQSGGHGVTPIDLSLKPGEPQDCARRALMIRTPSAIRIGLTDAPKPFPNATCSRPPVHPSNELRELAPPTGSRELPPNGNNKSSNEN